VILLVAQLELSSLRNVVRMQMTLGSDEQLAPKVQVIINRVGADSDITLKKAEETIGKSIYWQGPNDPPAVEESRNHGAPLVQHAPKSKVQQSIAGLVNLLCGKEAQAGPKDKGRGWLFSRR